MSNEVLTRVGEAADFFRGQAEAAEAEGMLPAATAQKLRDIGVMRMLQPVDHGGYEAHPVDFFESVMAISRYCGASGWISGVVGVHPWEIALMDRRLQDEIWGSDPDIWIASPYSPSGVATPVEGGYVLRGRWPFSSGTDQCDWVVLGAMQGDTDGNVGTPPVGLHVVLPRADYTIVEDSWIVAGLSGTGSKDVVVDGAFVPAYRTLRSADLLAGTVARESDRSDSPLYRMPWSSIFPNAITSAVIGICEGVIDAHIDYQRGRISPVVGPAAEDTLALHAVGKASSDVAASRTQLLSNVRQAFDIVADGGTVDLETRAAFRRDQVRCAWRAVEAVDEIVVLSGGNAMRSANPLQRLWRDAHVGLHHAIHVSNGVYQFYSSIRMGVENTSPIRYTI